MIHVLARTGHPSRGHSTRSRAPLARCRAGRRTTGRIGIFGELVEMVLLVTVLIGGLGVTAALACTLDTECDDGLACNGGETCQAGSCVAGSPVDCSAAGDQCNDAACEEPTGTCALTPKIDGFGCDDGNECSTFDTCQNGACVGAGGEDSDGDGYCDTFEAQAQCHGDDPQEIPLQPNVYSGGRANTHGEVLMTFRAPGTLNIRPGTDPSCATAGACNLVTHFCTLGKVDDPCTSAADCNQPAGTCRVVINYGAAPDLVLMDVSLKLRGKVKQVLLADFLPATPGCSRKVDIVLPSGFNRGVLRFKAGGTTSGRHRRDRDRIKYRE